MCVFFSLFSFTFTFTLNVRLSIGVQTDLQQIDFFFIPLCVIYYAYTLTKCHKILNILTFASFSFKTFTAVVTVVCCRGKNRHVFMNLAFVTIFISFINHLFNIMFFSLDNFFTF